MSTQALVLAAAVALGAAVGGAQASPAVTASYPHDQLTVRVSVADLDLRKDAGAVVALHRIRGAARMVCSSERLSSGFNRYSLYRTCVSATTEKAAATLLDQFASNPDNGTASLLLAVNR